LGEETAFPQKSAKEAENPFSQEQSGSTVMDGVPVKED